MMYISLHATPAAQDRLRDVLGDDLDAWRPAADPAEHARVLGEAGLTAILAEAEPEVIRQVHARRPEVPLIVVADVPDAETAAACFRAGAADVIAWARLETLPAALAAAQRRVHIYGSLRRQTAELTALYQVSRVLLSAPANAVELAQRITDQLAATLELDDIGIGLVDSEHRQVVFVARTTQGPATNEPLPLDGMGLTVAAIRSGAPVYAPDVTRDPRYFVDTATTRSELAVPLVAGGQVLGVLDLQSPQVDAFSPSDQRLALTLAEHTALALQNVQLMQALTEARHAAEAANHAKSEFLANISHELRSPLTHILGSLDLVLDGLGETPEEEHRFVETARQAAQQLLGLINNLLDIAKLEAGQLSLNPAALPAALLVSEAVALTAAAAADKRLTVTLAPPAPDLPAVWTDHPRTRQILLHLLDNAIKFTPASGRIQVAVAGAGPRVQIQITDTGLGLTADQQARLFQPFSQADGSSTRQFGGSGLGLSLAWRLAGLMGGALELQSDGLNRGTTFTLSLPAATPEQTEV